MHIAVLNLTSGEFSGGYRKYLRTLLPLIRADARVSRLDVFNPPGALLQKEADGIDHLSWPDGDAMRGFRALKARLMELSPDVVFIPTAQWLPLGIPTMVMVRNMEPLLVPFAGNSPATAARNLVRRYLAHRACKRADRVLAVSGHVKEFIISRWGIAEDRVGTVLHGVGPALPPEKTHRPAMIPAGLHPTLFTAGSVRPARGLEDLINALGDLRHQDITPTLIIAGETNRGSEGYKPQIESLAKRRNVAGQLVWTGQLKEAEIAWCLRECDVFVMTSRAEACPNTALEAMSYGAVSVAGNNAPMPEIFGDTAIYYPSGNGKMLADCLRSVLVERDRSVKETMARNAMRRAGQFSWRETAERTVTELEKCAKRSVPNVT